MEPISINTTDHDLLIRLDTKMNQLSIDFKNLADGTTIRIANHEIRIAAIEQKVHDYSLTWKLMIAMATGIGSLITFILAGILSSLKIINFK